MWTTVLLEGLLFGGLISLWMLIAIVASLRWNPEIWVNDYPPEIRVVLPPKSERARRQTLWVSIPTFVVLIGLLAWLVARLYAAAGGFPGSWELAAALWLAMQTFNLFDLLIVDWLLVETWRPSFVLMPGTAAFADRRFYGFHFRGFLKGFVGITVLSLIVAGGIALVSWLM